MGDGVLTEETLRSALQRGKEEEGRPSVSRLQEDARNHSCPARFIPLMGSPAEKPLTLNRAEHGQRWEADSALMCAQAQVSAGTQ